MSFYMNMALNEGQQKDDYIKRKVRERNDKYFKNYRRIEDKINAHDNKPEEKSSSGCYSNPGVSRRANFEIDSRRYGRIDNKTLRGLKRNASNDTIMRQKALHTANAIARHNRRHPDAKLESGIFSECNFIEFAY